MQDLLDQALIEHGSFVPKEQIFVPNQAVKQIVKILRNTLTRRNATVREDYHPQLDYECIGDVDRIQQVLLNLTSNARKYIPKGTGEIQIQTLLLKEGGNHFIRVNVIDNGPGISVEGQA